MVCRVLDPLIENSIVGILAYPTVCDYYFYLEFMAGLFLIITLILKAVDDEKFIKSDTISAMGVSATAVIFLSLMGTTWGFIQADIFIEILVGGMIFVVLWLLKK